MSEELDPEEYHVLNKSQKKLALIITSLVVLLIVPPVSYMYYKFAVNRPSQTRDETTVQVGKGSSIHEIAKELYEEDVLNSKYLFIFYALINGIDKNIQAGTYTIPAGTSLIELAEIIQHGTNDVKITFIEGWRVEEFALAAAGKFPGVHYEDFVEQARESEGYLFPDTYFFNAEAEEGEIIEHLKQTFDDKTKDVLTPENLDAVDLTRDQVVTFASIVEREVSDGSDRPIVAGILINRWRSDQPLGADATTQYVVALKRVGCDEDVNNMCPSDDAAQDVVWWPKELTVSELRLDSSYNTRVNTGLPPTAISSVSLESLKAVLEFKNTSYNYYLTDDDGVTHYAETLEEHNQNIARYL